MSFVKRFGIAVALNGLAVATCACTIESGPVPDLPSDVDVGADRICRVKARPVECELVGEYLRSTVGVKPATMVALAVSKQARYDEASKALGSLQRAGYMVQFVAYKEPQR